MTTILTIAAIAVLVLFLFIIFVIVLAIWMLHRLEKFLKRHKTTLQAAEVTTGLLATLIGVLPSIVAAVIGLRGAFTTTSKKTVK
jgi:fumarate reductase subunit D